MTTFKKTLGVFTLAMMSVAGIINLRNLPFMASIGWHAVFFYLMAGLLFLIPSALVCAELASTYTEAGGVYLWVRKAFGDKTAFFTMWSEWINNVISTPASLSFLVATLAFLFAPSLAESKVYLLTTMLAVLWGVTLLNFLHIGQSSRLNTLGALFGTIIPGLFIIVLGAIWIFTGHPSQISFSWNHLVPPMHLKNFVFFLGVISAYAGMQITAFHIQDVKDPARNFPKAIGLASIIILAITIFSSLAIAMVVPSKTLSLVSGVMQGFQIFLSSFHLNWLLPILILLILLSSLSTTSAWILGPARGMLVAAQHGLFPKWFAKENKNGMPVNVLILQGVIATILMLPFLFMPSFSAAFWMLMVLTSQFTAIVYILLFASAIWLRHKDPDRPRPFCVPGGKIGIWIISGISILVCMFGLILGYLPPAELNVGSLKIYESVIIFGNVCYLIVPILIYVYAKKQIRTQ